MRPRGRARCERTRSERQAPTLHHRCRLGEDPGHERRPSLADHGRRLGARRGQRRRMRAERERRLDRVTARLRVRAPEVDRRAARPPAAPRARRGRATAPARGRAGGQSPADLLPRMGDGRSAAGRECSRARTGPSPGRSGRRPPAPAPSTPACPASTPEIGALRDERASRASPKSVTTSRPLPRSTRTFAGVRSRWTTPRACA